MNKSSIPNLFTYLNLSLGIIAIILCFEDRYLAANICILTAALADRYDGRIARSFNAVSPLGKELDSLSDLVSFGVAPMILAWTLSLHSLIPLGYVALLLYPICSAFRLARYNVTEFSNVYMGVPITVAGSIVALDNIASFKLANHAAVTLILVLLLSYLMISKIEIKKI